MNKVKQIVNLVLAAVSLAMGIAVIVMTTINAGIAPNDLFKLLGIAVAALGVLALNSVQKS